MVHIHHGIRGKEADRDQSFVENICRKWQIPCTVYCYDVPGLSREWKLGEEETGRIVRKEAFQREAAVCGRKDSEIKIALAHNQEDLAETMLHNLCRGTGLRGLCTMRPVDGEIIRPILCLSRDKNCRVSERKRRFLIFRTAPICQMNIPETESDIIFFLCWNSRSMERQRHIWQRLRQGFPRQKEYLTQQSCLVLGEFHKGKEYYLTENFYGASDHSGLCITTGDGTAGRQTEGSGGCSL